MMAYDSVDGYVVLYGGETDSSPATFLSDTWTYHTGTWTQLSPSLSPPARTAGALSWDGADSELVLFGGTNTYGAQLGDTWTFSGGQWSQDTSSTNNPQARSDAMIAYDAADHYTMMYGGYTSASGGATNCGGYPEFCDLWEFKAGQWTQLSLSGAHPNALYDGSMVFDGYDNYIMLFGGRQNNPPYWTWYTFEYSGGTWFNITGSTAPPGDYCGHLTCQDEIAYDALDHDVVYETQAGGTEHTWFFQSGTWTDVTATAGAIPASRDGTAAYDTSDGYVVAVPGLGVSTFEAYSYPGIFGVTVGANQLGVDVGQTLTLTASVSGGVPQFTYSWPTLPSGCTSSNSATISCPPSATGSTTVQVHVTDSGGRSATYNGPTVTVSPAPSVATPSSSIPFGDVNEQVTFSTSVSGGPGTYVIYNWNQVPTGCTSANTSSLACTPSSQGKYNVQVAATDGNHDTRTSSLISYTVLANPTVTLAENHSVIDLGESLKFWANASGGTGVYTYTYNNLPTGCISANVSVLACKPQASATGVTVTVVDTIGGTATSGPVSFTVDPDPVVTTAFTRGGPNAYANEYLQVQISYSSGTPSYLPCIYIPGSAGIGASGWSCGPWQGGSHFTFGFWYASTGSYTIETSLEDSTGWNVTYTFTENIYASLSSGGVSLPSVTDQGMTVTGQTTIQNGIPGFNLWFNDTTTSSLLCTASPTGDGSASCSFVVSWTGTHNVELTVRDSGWDSYFANLTLGANPALHGLGLNVTAGSFSATQGQTLQDEITASTQFTGAYQGGTAPITVTWSFNTSVTMGTGSSLTYSWAHSAIYTVKETVQDNLGDVLSGTILVQVNPPASGLALSSHFPSLDAGTSDNLTVNFTGGLAPFTFSWNFGDGTQSSGTHPWTAHSWSAAGPYTISVTVKDAAGVQLSTGTQVTVVSAPSVGNLTASSASASVHAGGTLATYENATVQFSGQVLGGSSPYVFTWSSNGTTLGSVQSSGPWYNLTFVWRTTGIFDITFTVTDKEGHSSSAGAQIIVRQDGIGLASISAQRSTLDAGVFDNLTLNFQGGLAPYSFGWILGDGSGTYTTHPWLVHAWSTAGSFLVSVTIQDSLGATITLTTTITVNPPLIAPCAPAANASVIWASDPVSLSLGCTKNGTSPYSFDWNYGDGTALHGIGSTTSHTWSAAGNYSVRVIVNDSGGGSVIAAVLHVQVVALIQTVPVIESGTYQVLGSTAQPSWKQARISVSLTTLDPYGTVVSWREVPVGASFTGVGWRAWGSIVLTLNVSQANATQVLVFEVANSLGRASVPYDLTVNLTSLFPSNPGGGPGSNGGGGLDLGAEVLLATVIAVAVLMAVLAAWALTQRRKRQQLQTRGPAGSDGPANLSTDRATVALLNRIKSSPGEEEEALVQLVSQETDTPKEDVRLKLGILAERHVVRRETGSGGTRYYPTEKGNEALSSTAEPVLKEAVAEGERQARIRAAITEAVRGRGPTPLKTVHEALGRMGFPPGDVQAEIGQMTGEVEVVFGGPDRDEPYIRWKEGPANPTSSSPSITTQPSIAPGAPAAMPKHLSEVPGRSFRMTPGVDRKTEAESETKAPDERSDSSSQA